MADLADGESVEMQGSGSKPYVLKNVGGVYSCTCPAWRNQPAPIERRTCKHLRKLRGDAQEQERVGAPVVPRPETDGEDGHDGPPLLLAHTWDSSTDLTGWWMSEKLDGVRAFWDGRGFVSRQGNAYLAPDWFVAGLPDVPLDGELWIDRRQFQRTVSIVRRQDRSDHWKDVRYVVFDAPRAGGEFESRLRFLEDVVRSANSPYTRLHEHRRCDGLSQLRAELARVESLGGEGLMLRQPGSLYEAGRSSTLLKIKTFHDAEAVVLAHQPGKGKHSGKLGALAVRLADGTEFSVGTGFTEAERAAPPPVGSVITFRYQELSDGGVPRFPSFVRVAGTAPIAPGREAPPAVEPVAKPEAVPGPEARTRRFTFVEGTSSKFWEVSVEGSTVTVRYGRIGSPGVTNVKTFADPAAARKQADRLVEEKTGKGYKETGSSS